MQNEEFPRTLTVNNSRTKGKIKRTSTKSRPLNPQFFDEVVIFIKISATAYA